MPVSGGKIIPYHTIFGNVHFENVCFTYPTRKNQVSKNFVKSQYCEQNFLDLMFGDNIEHFLFENEM